MNLFMPTTETKRLILRPLRITDANDLYQICKDKRVNCSLGLQILKSIEETQRLIETELLPLPGYNKPEVMVIEERISHKMIGLCHFTEVKGNDIAEIGYCLNYDFWNQGYISEALEKLIELGFTSLGLRRIEAVCSIHNLKSQRVIEKAGFTLEGILRRYMFDKTVNDYADCRFYSLLKEEWEAKKYERISTALPAKRS